MSEIKITKDAASLLMAAHKQYKKRRTKGEPKQEAVTLGDPSNIRQEIMLEWSLEDIEDACWELCRAGLFECLPGDNSLQMVWLANQGIAYAEDRQAGVLKTIWDCIKELLAFIP